MLTLPALAALLATTLLSRPAVAVGVFGRQQVRSILSGNSSFDRFVNGGPRVCTTHPHPFFGRLTPAEWAIQQYKHLDHHLRQFGA